MTKTEYINGKTLNFSSYFFKQKYYFKKFNNRNVITLSIGICFQIAEDKLQHPNTHLEQDYKNK